MGVVYDPKRGLQRVDYSCGAKVGDIVVAYDSQSYRVVCQDDYGCYVCENLNEDCLARDDIRTFDDFDIQEVIPGNDPRFTAHGEGI